MTEVKETKEQEKKEEAIRFKGKYISATGRRKTSVARVRLYKKGIGAIVVNDTKVNEYFTPSNLTIVKQPIKLSGLLKDFNFSVNVIGGGKKGQAEAVRHGIAQTLVIFDEKLKPGMRAKGWITRDARKKERKKPGLKKARRAPQWSKR